ncbi:MULTISPECIES: Dam family site-specific DNA-(adenine-N6)-methyltransferase [Aeribacillus]|uniref:Dam family site-specific DNA-(adenine-N6)-methyltransferase n=1 Tax=Aeribacillus TaxID=1055323 RepID=UPI0007B491EE|nr:MULTISPECIES: Dam family site-specific DNA-(adenine-N6)-methyltransferase [Aeribacillus]KZM57060.1 DNA adenine methylase [Aeribacillus pallidus]MED0652082.1 Dam family site-specific DNA-(adenine-N6)-methyltransferase [Aeribacillus composti]MED4488433.1 Dam family site-specific DNA-(adenine-N6)-methyltransferase [Aeribacillus pallidus]
MKQIHHNEIIDNNIKVKPVLKWAGGKQQLLDVLIPQVPKNFNRYIEPFLGGGALFFALKPKNAIIADLNPELINLYKIIASNVEELISILKEMKNDEKYYYEIRELDPTTLSNVEQAARTIYLNRTCYNGLYRVNRQGKFNTPFGHYKNPTICDEQNLKAASIVLQGVEIIHGDYKKVLKEYAQPGDFIYLDPPYLPISTYSDFKRYTKEQFYEEDHIELAEEVHRLHELGCYVLLTNSNHPLVHELYGKYSISVHKTRRNINSKGSKRTGEDVLIKVEPKKRIYLVPRPIELPQQMEKFPSTRFMGSKQNLIEHIWGVASQFEFNSVLDLFSGTGVVSYMFKTQNKQVFSNDYMAFCANFAKALVENSEITLNDKDLQILFDPETPKDYFVSNTFKELYFSDEDNNFIDLIRSNLSRLKNKYKKAIAISALARACLKKRPRGIFTYTGFRYDDGRRDLILSLKDQFIEAVQTINQAIFDNGKDNKARHGDAMNCRKEADLVYIDPPYYSPLSDNEYVRRYHFVEGLACDWKGVEMQWHTKTKKFKSYPTPFSSQKGAYEAFDILFRKHKNSILIVSYSSNSLPTKDEMLSLISKYKENVDVVAIDYRYSFGNHGHKVKDNNNLVKEYLFVGY